MSAAFTFLPVLGQRRNNFGVVRVVLAVLVIISHAPEIIDGNRSRELLTRAFGTLSFGEMAVDGFFLVSGYLIAHSARTTPNYTGYLTKRILRIYPGFVMAFLTCLVIVAPSAGGTLGAIAPADTAARILFLASPVVPGSFAGLPYPFLDHAMWTISYEFRCYVLMALLGAAGALRSRGAYLSVLASLLILYVFRSQLPEITPLGRLVGIVPDMIRLSLLFICGGTFYLFADRIRYTHRGAALAVALLLPLMYSSPLSEPAFAVLGGYLIFWFALAVPQTTLSQLTERVDISYGLYLYAWPIQSLLALYVPGISPWLMAILAVMGAGGLGVLSWRFIERPALRFQPRFMAALKRADSTRPTLPSSAVSARRPFSSMPNLAKPPRFKIQAAQPPDDFGTGPKC
ncbi:acyltransferase [Methylobacterium sp. WL18]|uniref:acyltransferase family protein n=1 Tax=Methylobacterium sp. WL18 TaxID=2603897 RepID=UPI0011CC85A5|nr:acyltransferase [Methylobacterium sp. WL18]TXN73481.1 acyltransferase [Methylobacterium sp. WL18]